MDNKSYRLALLTLAALGSWVIGPSIGIAADDGAKELAARIEKGLGQTGKDELGEIVSVTLVPFSDKYVESLNFALFDHLEQLNVLSSHISDRSLVHFSKTIRPGLQWLSITGARITDKRLGALLDKHRGSLTTLWLDHSTVTDEIGPAIAKLENLFILELSGTRITDKCLQCLTGLEDLRYLLLASTKVSDGGMAEIAKLSNLRFLDIDGTNVTDKGLQELANMTELGTLSVRNTKVTENGKAALREALPDLRFE